MAFYIHEGLKRLWIWVFPGGGLSWNQSPMETAGCILV